MAQNKVSMYKEIDYWFFALYCIVRNPNWYLPQYKFFHEIMFLSVLGFNNLSSSWYIACVFLSDPHFAPMSFANFVAAPTK